jgi:hypothetical protein
MNRFYFLLVSDYVQARPHGIIYILGTLSDHQASMYITSVRISINNSPIFRLSYFRDITNLRLHRIFIIFNQHSDVQEWRESNQSPSTRMGNHKLIEWVTFVLVLWEKGPLRKRLLEKGSQLTNRQRSNYVNNAYQEEKELVFVMKHHTNSRLAPPS